VKLLITTILFLNILVANAQFATSPFSVTTTIKQQANHKTTYLLTVKFTVPAQMYLYDESIAVIFPPQTATTLIHKEKGKAKQDQFSQKTHIVHGNDFSYQYQLKNPIFPLKITVQYQGCNANNCYFPQEQQITITPNSNQQTKSINNPQNDNDKKNWQIQLQNFQEIGRTSGYVSPEKFLVFLDDPQKNNENFLANKKLILVILIIIIGGLALNLTPCVLPMIPINIAIIGAGNKNNNHKQGFLLGLSYALGIAIAYGVLGAFIVLSGSRFGTINSSPWFNLTIAIIFIILALAMFDKIHIDLSRFQKNTINQSQRGTHLLAFSMGAIFALLAGACVAPVVIAVFLFSASLYTSLPITSLLLPFLLGIGMGLPWPFLGAGLSLLPKPGKWMQKVKYLFGIFIITLAIYYTYLGISLMSNNPSSTPQTKNQLSKALQLAQTQNKAIIIDFWGDWCKNCTAMEKTTFKNKKVQQKLKKYIICKFDASKIKNKEIKEVLKHFNIVGLPAYIILKPETKDPKTNKDKSYK